MDPITTAVLAAVAAGAASGLTEVSKRLIVDAYTSFKALLKDKLGKDSPVVAAVEKVEQKPDREGPKISLQEEIEDAGADKNTALVQAANSLLDLIKRQEGAQEIAGTIAAIGDRSIAAGSITGSTVSTGDSYDTGGGAFFMGDVDAGGDVVGRDKIDSSSGGASAEDLVAAFKKVYDQLASKPAGPEKTVAEEAVKAIEEEAKKGEEADEAKTAKWVDILEKTLPDVAEVAVEALLNPGAAAGSVVRKVLQHTRENLKSKGKEAKG